MWHSTLSNIALNSSFFVIYGHVCFLELLTVTQKTAIPIRQFVVEWKSVRLLQLSANAIICSICLLYASKEVLPFSTAQYLRMVSPRKARTNTRCSMRLSISSPVLCWSCSRCERVRLHGETASPPFARTSHTSLKILR